MTQYSHSFVINLTSLLPILLLLLFMLEPIVGGSSFSLKYLSHKTIQSIMTDSNNNTDSQIILGADNYINLYMWKDTNVSSLDSLNRLERGKRFRFFSFVLEQENLERLFTKHIPQVYSGLGMENNLSWVYLHANLGDINTECLQGSIFENFDGLVDVSNEFSRRIRMARTHYGYRKKDTSQFIEPSDFNVIPLFPINFYVSNKTNLDSNFESEKSEMISVIEQNMTLTEMNCKQVVQHDGRVIERAHGLVNFTSQEIHLASLVYNVKLRYSYSVLQSLSYYDGLYWNQSEIDLMLWSSSCHYCTTQSCVAENWKWYDTIDMVGLSLGFVYWILIFASLQFMQPAIKRRLAVPYVGIFLSMMSFLVNINAFNSGCVSVSSMGNLYGTSVLVAIYTSTLLRYYYLKNMFTILKHSKFPKFHRTMSSTWVGLIVTAVLPFFYCFILLSAIIPLFQTYNVYLWNLVGTVILIALVAVSSMLGFTSFLVDVFTHRKGIREKGLRKFFFFDDPFNIRLDLASLGFIIILLIALVIAYLLEPNAIAVFRLLIGILVYGICGGNVTMIALGRRLLNIRRSSAVVPGKNGDDFLSSLVKGDISLECYGLFKEYCEKEMSLENILLIEKLVEVRKKPQLFKIKFLQDLVKDHLESISIYQVNVSHETKENLKKLLDELVDDNVSSKTSSSYNGKHIDTHLLDDIYNQILDNLKDPFSRFQYTSEFKDWVKVFAIQKELDVV